MRDHKLNLVALVDGREVARLAPPDVFPSRDWLLGVVAVQASVENGRPRALLRANLTGLVSPVIVPLGSTARIEVALVSASASASGPEPEPEPEPDVSSSPVAASLSLCLSRTLLARVTLTRDRLAAHPRAFSHIYCRWLRDGTYSAGVDLTAFLTPPPGSLYERTVTRDLLPGAVATVVWRDHTARPPTS